MCAVSNRSKRTLISIPSKVPLRRHLCPSKDQKEPTTAGTAKGEGGDSCPGRPVRPARDWGTSASAGVRIGVLGLGPALPSLGFSRRTSAHRHAVGSAMETASSPGGPWMSPAEPRLLLYPPAPLPHPPTPTPGLSQPSARRP